MLSSEDKIQEETSILKQNPKMADKENASRRTQSKNNAMIRKNCVPLKLNKSVNSATAADTRKCEDNKRPLSVLLTKDDHQIQHRSLNQTFDFKKNNKEKLMSTEKLKQDVSMPKKPVLGLYRGKVVESKVSSFRKPLQVKDESSVANKKLAGTVSSTCKPQPVHSSRVTVSRARASEVTSATENGNTASHKRQLVRPPIRSQASSSQDQVKQGVNRTSAHVTVRKGAREKEFLPLKTALSTAKTNPADLKRNEARSKSLAFGTVPRPASSSSFQPIGKSKAIDQRRKTLVKANISLKAIQSKETVEQRIARLAEYSAGKGSTPKMQRSPSSAAPQPEPEEQSEKPLKSFWASMAEEDEQRLFTEKVNKTFSECLNLITEGCRKEEIMSTVNDLVKNIPDATKLIKYWVCLARLEPRTSPIENIIAIYERAVLAGAQVR
ncbi:PREDICTED: cytoskeleton-associated protein 2 [Elephantulus edwardii]|uniref:cytoskeleton-associated protein 2 n=1 Tax=Elephantulus edwardii TaxID=28737 RepID=UPI0003F07165|nr:PREDICTED: cytoskeleton-associated protein 2 [Elephantulus edwardii]